VAQSTSDRGVALRREQIMQARCLWENTASEEALGQLFGFCSRKQIQVCHRRVLLRKTREIYWATSAGKPEHWVSCQVNTCGCVA